MIERYRNALIAKIWTDEETLLLWQRTELAAIKARVMLGGLDDTIYDEVERVLCETPIDLIYWKQRDKEIHHDLNAFIDERIQHLNKKLHEYFHKKMTSFDTQEPAFAYKLLRSLQIISGLYDQVEEALIVLARKHRYTIMNARTHGQEAELQTFGARCLTWLQQLRIAGEVFHRENPCLKYSKLSGAIGKFGSLEPELEVAALKIMNLEAFRGATQIMPRIIYLPLAQSMSAIVQVLNNIALDIRLSARSGRTLMREPFKKKQKGSSAMPHKKNPIRCEQVEGMDRLARGYQHMIEENVRTWEERAIEQSSVERVAWPDLFHVTARALSEMAYILGDLRVYPEAMLSEVYKSCGVYASSEAKEFLKERASTLGLDHEDVYRLVQLACFNVFEPPKESYQVAGVIAKSFSEAHKLLKLSSINKGGREISIQDFIPAAILRISDELDISEEQVANYNSCLNHIFSVDEVRAEWDKIFEPEFLLHHQDVLYRDILCE